MPPAEPLALIRAGKLAQLGLLDDAAVARAAEIVAEVAAEGIETIRVVFPDQHGILRGKTITARALASAFAQGVTAPSTLLLKDTSHRTVFPVWSADPATGEMPLRGANDVLMVPDPTRFQRLPWSPHSAILVADVVYRTGEALPIAARGILRRAVDQLARRGWRATMGLEVEFQVFEVVDPALDHGDSTMPPSPPKTRALTQGYQYLTETRYAEAEGILDRLRRMAEGLGLPVQSVEIEMGPSQFEFTFAPGDPMLQADQMVLFRTMVKEVCQMQGLHGSFMARPALPNAAANGWHIHQSIQDSATRRNLFTPGEDGALTPEAAGWIAGLLENAEASCLLTTPTVNGYKRFAPYQLAPNRIQWGEDNRGAMIRALLYPGDPAARVENRVADSTANPYLAFAAQILSGLDGVNRGLTPAPASKKPYDDGAQRLPENLAEAVASFERSPLYRQQFGSEVVDYLCQIKRAEWRRYLATISEWEQAEYFSLF